MGVGFSGDQQAFAFGASKLLDDGRTSFKASVTIDTQSRVSGGFGVGWQF
jgi:autotransporter adhesin